MGSKENQDELEKKAGLIMSALQVIATVFSLLADLYRYNFKKLEVEIKKGAAMSAEKILLYHPAHLPSIPTDCNFFVL
ncbi:MAG: hypothetical protein ACE5IF_01500 [Candidatus Bathyarchaeia archaeon]